MQLSHMNLPFCRSKIVTYWQFHMTQPLMLNAHWQEIFCKNILKDDGKNGDNTILDRYKRYVGFFVYLEIIATYIRELKTC